MFCWMDVNLSVVVNGGASEQSRSGVGGGGGLGVSKFARTGFGKNYWFMSNLT